MIYSDVQLLSVFDEIYKTRSVSRAAEALGLGQPAVSVALSKLRRHFGDSLFVRTKTGMDPTPLGEELVRPVRAALDALDQVLGHRSVFDPHQSQRCFRICMSDMTQVAVLPEIWPRLSSTAPGVKIEVVPVVTAEATAHMLESGEADLAIGFMPRLESGFFQQVLFHEHYVVLASTRHPRVRDQLTEADLAREGHAVFSTMGSGHRQLIEDSFRERGIERKVQLTIPNFLGASFVIERTDLLMVVPQGLGTLIYSRGDFRIFPLPFANGKFTVKQHWHERYHHDPGSQWLRALIFELLSRRFAL